LKLLARTRRIAYDTPHQNSPSVPESTDDFIMKGITMSPMPPPLLLFVVRRRAAARWVAPAALIIASITGCADSGPIAQEIPGATNLHHDGDLYVAGAVDEAGLTALKERGVTTVIDLRMPEQVSPEEADQANALGLHYVHLPMQSDHMTDEQAREFLDTMKGCGHQPTLIHCASGNRAAAMYGLYLGYTRQCDEDEALTRAKAAGLRNDTLARDVELYIIRENLDEEVAATP
jgi:uncharacterized protein (TIGR01244 family)